MRIWSESTAFIYFNIIIDWEDIWFNNLHKEITLINLETLFNPFFFFAFLPVEVVIMKPYFVWTEGYVKKMLENDI